MSTSHRLRKVLLPFLVLAAASAAPLARSQQGPGQTPASPSRATLVVRGVTLIDGTGAASKPGATIVVRDTRITGVLDAGVPVPPADLVLDGTGLFALPGLIDAHVHLSGASWEQETDRLRRILRGGVTVVWDVAGDDRQVADLSRAAMAGEIESPAIYYASLMAGPRFFTDPRAVASSLGYRSGDAPWARAIGPDSDLVRAVAAARGAGANALKLYAALDGATVRRIGDEARRQGLRMVAHGTVFPAKPGDLVAAGVNMLAHTPYLVWEGSAPSDEFEKRARGDYAGVPADGPVIGQLLASMRDHDVALNPTLWIFAEGSGKDDLSALRTPWMNTVTRRAQDMGVTIAAGTDSVFSPNVDRLPILHRELESLVAAGLTPMQALVAATHGAAHAMGLEAERGTLQAGHLADIVLVDASPVEDIRNTRRIRYVIQNGRIVQQAAPRSAR